MYSDYINIEDVSPLEIDDLLAVGWFRMGQKMFTTSFLNFDNQIYVVSWLRIELSKFHMKNSQKELLSKNSKFKVVFGNFEINEQIENLYNLYRMNITFNIAETLHKHLFEEGPIGNISKAVYVYDGNRLIACGIFDIGVKAMAGISCFYDPEYSKYSLGKFLMLQKILLAIQEGLVYFYPGYFVPGYSRFDYKLNLSSRGIEFYDPCHERWSGIENYDSQPNEISVIKARLKDLSITLEFFGIKHSMLFYSYFDYNLYISFNEFEPFINPCFIRLDETENENSFHSFIFNTRIQKFQLIVCWKYAEVMQYQPITGFYNENFLVNYKLLASETTAKEIVVKSFF